MVSVASSVQPLSERRFFSWMALAMAAVILVGFGPTYFFAAFNDSPTPILTPRLHVHGALATAWVLLLAAQTRLIATGQRDVHKRLGIAGAVLATAILISGLFVAVLSERRVHTDVNAGTFADPYVFLIFPFFSVGLFGVLVAFGILNRRRADAHKRFMLLATMSLIVPALARLFTMMVKGTSLATVPGPIGALMLIDLFIAALAAYDISRLGRLHPVTLWAGGFYLLSQPLRVAIGLSEPWQAFARSLMG
jgi:uncharacterized membrane protein YozB (DUF420 family)